MLTSLRNSCVFPRALFTVVVLNFIYGAVSGQSANSTWKSQVYLSLPLKVEQVIVTSG